MRRVAATVVPTLVGVNRDPEAPHPLQYRCPHAGGGEPATHNRLRDYTTRCPHAGGGEPPHALAIAERRDGCPHAGGGEPFVSPSHSIAANVVPTLVGVNRQSEFAPVYPSLRCPHAGGGEPTLMYWPMTVMACCPHAGGGEPSTDGCRYAAVPRCPHAGGGEPAMSWISLGARRALSPRWWG